jgi:acetylxylan esterase
MCLATVDVRYNRLLPPCYVGASYKKGTTKVWKFPLSTMFNSLFLKLVAVSLVSGAFAAVNQLQQISNFGTNPTNVKAAVYRPTGLVAKPALILALHYCTGTGQAYFTGTQYANLADQYKSFMVLYPTAPDSGGCWDVHTNATFTHNAGGDSLGIASAVRYAISTYGVDASRVFVTGSSSGAMMTQVIVGACSLC